MKLRGIIEQCFSGRYIFRGFATLKNLVDLSKSNNLYQRPIEEERIKSLKNFFKDDHYIFFPELLFGLCLSDDTAFNKLSQDAAIKKGVLLDKDIKLTKSTYSSQKILGENPRTKVISLNFTDKIDKPLSRIDGNHRLSAAEELLSSKDIDPDTIALQQKIGNLIVPFSILLQSTSSESEKYEASFFYLINARAKSLTSEENLKSIFSIESFTKIEIDQLLGLDSEYIKKFITHFSVNRYSFVENVLKNETYTLSMELSKLIDSNTEFEKIINSIRCIDSLFIDKKITLANSNVILALLKVKSTKDDKIFEVFIKWLINNKLIEIEKISPDEIIEVFDKIHRKGPYKVFVAIPYISHMHVQDFNKLFTEVLDEIKKKEDVRLELIPIMRFRGSSQRIDTRLIQHIKECDIFIADLTGANDNVIYEVGLAEGNGKPMILIKEDNDYAKVPFDKNEEYDSNSNVPFDMDKLQWIPYERYGYYNKIKSIIKINLPEILKQKYNE